MIDKFLDKKIKLYDQDNEDGFLRREGEEIIFSNKITSFEVAEDLNAGGYLTGKKAGVFANLGTPTNTTITVADTYYPIAGTFTNDPIEDFTAVATPAIRYDGEKVQHFEIDWHAAIKGDSNGITVHVGIKKNGTLVDSSVMGTLLKFLGEEQALSGTAVVELEKDDEIQLVTTADGNGDIVTFEHFTTTISEFFD